MSKIKPKKVALPYSLKEVAEHFNYSVRKLELQLLSLSEQGEIHKHDIKKTGKGYRLSTLAASVLVFENDSSAEALFKLADLVEKEKDNAPKRYSHATLLCHCKLLQVRLENMEIDRKLEATERVLEDHDRNLDEIITFVDASSPSIN